MSGLRVSIGQYRDGDGVKTWRRHLEHSFVTRETGKKNGRVDGAVTLRGAGGTHPSVLLPLGGIEHYPGL